MEILLKILGVALLAFFVGWTIVETLAMRGGKGRPRPGPASGVETAIGNSALVTTAFSAADGGEIRGRVRFDGEDWNALFIGDPATPPIEGSQVTVVEIDSGHLEVSVE